MTLPPAGTVYRRPGETDVVVTRVTATTVHCARHPYTFEYTHDEFLTLLKATIAKDLKLAIAANLNNIDDDTEV